MTAVEELPLASFRDGTVAGAPESQSAPPTLILVVEGESIYRQLLSKALHSAGWEAQAADSAADAAEAFERNRYALVVIGTDGSWLDGYDVANRIRRIEKPGSKTPIIALTGETLQSDRKKRKAAGFDNYIAKPIRLSQVEKVLGRYIGTHVHSGPEAPRQELGALDERCIAELFQLVGGNSDQFKEAIAMCAANVWELTDAVRRAEEDGDFPALWESARRLKSISAQIGAGRVHAICSTIEALAKIRSAEGVGSLVQELALANERAQQELRAIKPRLDRPIRRCQPLPAAPGEVLVAENDALTARFLITVLTNNGFKVTHAADGNAALAQIAAKAFQLIIVDTALPGTDGFGVLAQSRLLPQHADTPLVLLSSRNADQSAVRAFELGADEHIAVPFNPMELLARIQRLIRR